jgi:hypothetical protein
MLFAGKYWKALGFKDPYSTDERHQFRLCDAQCPGEEHEAHDGQPAQPSFCQEPMFHAPSYIDPTATQGYVSSDGHSYK